MEITQERKWFSGTRTALTQNSTQYHGERNSGWYYVEFLSRAVLENSQYARTHPLSRVRCEVQYQAQLHPKTKF